MEESILRLPDCSALLPRGAPLRLAHWPGAFRWRWAGLWATCAGSLCAVLVFRRHRWLLSPAKSRGVFSCRRSICLLVSYFSLALLAFLWIVFFTPGLGFASNGWAFECCRDQSLFEACDARLLSTTGLGDFGALNNYVLFIYIYMYTACPMPTVSFIHAEPQW